MPSTRRWYRSGLALVVTGSLFIVWLMGAVGILGVEGDRADLLYLAVLFVALIGSLAVRVRPAGLVRIMILTAALIGAVGAGALLLGMHRAAHSSILEIGGLTVVLAVPYAIAAWCFHKADQPRPTASSSMSPRS